MQRCANRDAISQQAEVHRFIPTNKQHQSACPPTPTLPVAKYITPQLGQVHTKARPHKNRRTAKRQQQALQPRCLSKPTSEGSHQNCTRRFEALLYMKAVAHTFKHNAPHTIPDSVRP